MRHHLTRVLPWSPDELFDLVADVERYPRFVRWVTDLKVRNRRELEDGVVVLDADAGVRFSLIRERFATRVRADRAAHTIDVDLISGPFRKLENHWRFEPHPKGALLTFDIDFEFGTRFLERILAANFNGAANRLIGCFEDRARVLYG